MELNSAQAAALLGMNEPEIRQWAHEGKLPGLRAQGRLLFSRQALLEWALARGRPLHFGIAPEVEAQLPPVEKLFTPSRFHYDVPGSSFPEVLEAALDRFDQPLADKALVYDLLISREKLMTTAIGEGIAAPHLRVPVVVNVTEPIVEVFFTREPLEMGALDGKPVHTLFLLLSLAPKQHLELLARLAFLFRKPAFTTLLRERAEAERICQWIEGALAAQRVP